MQLSPFDNFLEYTTQKLSYEIKELSLEIADSKDVPGRGSESERDYMADA